MLQSAGYSKHSDAFQSAFFDNSLRRARKEFDAVLPYKSQVIIDCTVFDDPAAMKVYLVAWLARIKHLGLNVQSVSKKLLALFLWHSFDALVVQILFFLVGVCRPAPVVFCLYRRLVSGPRRARRMRRRRRVFVRARHDDPSRQNAITIVAPTSTSFRGLSSTRRLCLNFGP